MTKSADLATFTEEILNGKLHFCEVQNEFESKWVSTVPAFRNGTTVRWENYSRKHEVKFVKDSLQKKVYQVHSWILYPRS